MWNHLVHALVRKEHAKLLPCTYAPETAVISANQNGSVVSGILSAIRSICAVATQLATFCTVVPECHPLAINRHGDVRHERDKWWARTLINVATKGHYFLQLSLSSPARTLFADPFYWHVFKCKLARGARNWRMSQGLTDRCAKLTEIYIEGAAPQLRPAIQTFIPSRTGKGTVAAITALATTLLSPP